MAFNQYPYSCPTYQTPDADCGINLTLSCSAYVTRVCSEVTYTVYITNTSGETLNNAALCCPINSSLAFLPGTLTVNGTTLDNTTLDVIPLGDIQNGQTITVTYNCVVMSCQRYIQTQARMKFCICCCCNKKSFVCNSNTNCLQVCCCCSGTSSLS